MARKTFVISSKVSKELYRNLKRRAKQHRITLSKLIRFELEFWDELVPGDHRYHGLNGARPRKKIKTRPFGSSKGRAKSNKQE